MATRLVRWLYEDVALQRWVVGMILLYGIGVTIEWFWP